MKVNRIVWVIVGYLSVLGCQKNNQEQLDKDAKLMATLECEARQLKEERFKIANDIRFMEDSLMKHHIPLTASQRQQIDSVKTVLTMRTGKLADKITKTMDSLFVANYQTPEQRQTFDAATEKMLQEVCK
jgi:hypothetical protein